MNENILVLGIAGNESERFKQLSEAGPLPIPSVTDIKRVQAFDDDGKSLIDADVEEVLKCLEGCDIELFFNRLMLHVRTLFIKRNEHAKAPDNKDFIDPIEWNKTYLLPGFFQSLVVSFDIQYGTASISDATFYTAIQKAEEAIEASRIINNMWALYNSSIQDNSINLDNASLASEENRLLEIRGKRYKTVEIPYHKALLGRQSELLETLFGINAGSIVAGLDKVMHAHIFGFNEALERFTEHTNEHRQVTIINDERQTEYKNDIDDLIGLGLYDIEKATSWPKDLLECLSLPLGNNDWFTPCVEFAANKNPLKNLPTIYRPLLKIRDSYYCFSEVDFMDSFYRALYRACKTQAAQKSFVIKDIPLTTQAVTNKWNQQQATASESAIADLMENLLPGCLVHANNYYPIAGKTLKGSNLKENDLLVTYDDVLFAIEVKGGAYVTSDPVDDADAHRKALGNLIDKGCKQAASTIDYIRANSPATFYDNYCIESFTIDSSFYRKIYGLTVSVDEITELAARADKIAALKHTPGVVALSLSDLITYSQYFDNPLLFLHFFEQRSKATTCKRIAFNDELDHLGAYLSDNCYIELVNGVESEFDRVDFDSLRESLDTWFEGRYLGKRNIKKPAQQMPPCLMQLLTILGENGQAEGHRAVASTLLNMNEEHRKEISSALKRQPVGRQSPNHLLHLFISPHDELIPVSFVRQLSSAPCDMCICLDKATALMLDREETERAVTFIVYDTYGQMTSCNVKILKSFNISDKKRNELNDLMAAERAKRVSSFQKQLGRKIGRNEPCPCNSGKKFKKCCGK